MKSIGFKKEMVKFLAGFFILFLIVFIVLNVTGWLVRPKPINIASNESEISVVPEEEKCVFSEKSNGILIPKIGIEAPLVFPEIQDVTSALDRGVVFYPESSLPGQKGETVLLGHSAPLGWPKIRYDWVFSNLKNLESEDEIYIFFENCQYTYQVINKYFLDKGEDLPNRDLTNLENVLVLISCWPPGKDFRRIAVEAVITN